MKLSTKTRYGLRLLIGFALRYNHGFVQLNEVAKAEGISEKYAEQIVRLLKVGGILISQRGVQGGYTLAQHPREITVFKIFEALEGKFNIIDCGKCLRKVDCVAKKVWGKLTESMVNTLKSITLQDLVDEYKAERSKNVYYEI
ncbi:MAG: RrF2 family transcriptional regulator [Brevinematia bacterium]